MLAGFACWQVCACVCVCVNANAREEHLSTLVLFVTIIYKNDPKAGEYLNVYSVIVFVCVCVCVRGCFTDALQYFFVERDRKELAKCHVELCQYEL